MFRTAASILALAATSTALVSSAHAAADLRLRGIARGLFELKADVRYAERSSPIGLQARQVLWVQIENAFAFQRFDIAVAGQNLGSVVTDQFGRAEFKARVASDNAGNNVPSLPHFKAGDSFQVGTLRGTLASW